MPNIFRLRELPGVREIEAALHVPGRQLLPHFDDLEERIEDCSRRLFGVAENETYLKFDISDYRYDGVFRSLLPLAYDREREWVEHFEFLRFPWDEQRECWVEEDWDVAEPDGTPLECLRYFGRPIVCIIDAMLPKAALSADGTNPGSTSTQWGRSMEEAARQFLDRRGRR